jgi:hypothetical protein
MKKKKFRSFENKKYSNRLIRLKTHLNEDRIELMEWFEYFLNEKKKEFSNLDRKIKDTNLVHNHVL